MIITHKKKVVKREVVDDQLTLDYIETTLKELTEEMKQLRLEAKALRIENKEQEVGQQYEV